MWYIDDRETGAKAARLPFSEGSALQTKERGVANGYIFGFIPVLYTIDCPCGSVLSDFQGQKKVAATTAIVTAEAIL